MFFYFTNYIGPIMFPAIYLMLFLSAFIIFLNNKTRISVTICIGFGLSLLGYIIIKFTEASINANSSSGNISGLVDLNYLARFLIGFGMFLGAAALLYFLYHNYKNVN